MQQHKCQANGCDNDAEHSETVEDRNGKYTIPFCSEHGLANGG